MGEKRKVYNVLWESTKERGLSEDRGLDGRKGLEWILRIMAGGVEWTQLAQNRVGSF
jgi:hypothetical protein